VIRFLLLSIFIMLLARSFWRVMDGVIAAAGGGSTRPRPPAQRALKLTRDPVCGTFVSPASAVALTTGDVTHHFCSEACRDAFRRGGSNRLSSHAS
jgi:YHS domain-containing protein